MNGTIGLAEPPEGVVRGESVPVENDGDAIDEAVIDKTVGQMKTMPGYSELTDRELREIAVDRLQSMGEIE